MHVAIEPVARVPAEIGEKIQAEAWKLYRKYEDKDFDLIDATSFAFASHNRIRQVLTLDRHFSQMGFAVIP